MWGGGLNLSSFSPSCFPLNGIDVHFQSPTGQDTHTPTTNPHSSAPLPCALYLFSNQVLKHRESLQGHLTYCLDYLYGRWKYLEFSCFAKWHCIFALTVRYSIKRYYLGSISIKRERAIVCFLNVVTGSIFEMRNRGDCCAHAALFRCAGHGGLRFVTELE